MRSSGIGSESGNFSVPRPATYRSISGWRLDDVVGDGIDADVLVPAREVDERAALEAQRRDAVADDLVGAGRGGADAVLDLAQHGRDVVGEGVEVLLHGVELRC